MKYYLNIICIILLASCSQKMYSPQVKNNSTTEEGTIRIQSSGEGKNLPDAYSNAVENAFSTVLFKGVPESIQATPMIPDEPTARQQYASVLSCFKDKTCYTQFLTSASQNGKKERVRGSSLINYQVQSDVTINIRALRTYLEQNNVIRKFGY
ncbi:MAG TPA: hypothetical protein VIJ57_11315 [Hanamia sp.]